MTVSTSTLPAGTVGTAYSQTLTATGGTSPYSWSVTTGTLPAGLNMSSGVISGSPTTAGTSTFTVQVTDSSSPAQTATKSLSIQVN
nr:Ig domain-containing protein [Geomonas sp. Red32]